MQPQIKVYAYRWIILASVAPIIAATQILWLALAPIAGTASEYYHTGSFGISIFSTSYMLMYILFTLPASWVVDRFGYRRSAVIGALITAVFAALRAMSGSNFTLALLCQFCIAAGQPFILNVVTKVPAVWFPLSERSLATGVLTLAQYVGLILPMVLSPILAPEPNAVRTMLAVYAIVAAVCAVAVIAFARGKPPLPPDSQPAREEFNIKALRGLFGNRNYLYVLLLTFISLGVFNTLLTEIESILVPRGLTSDQAGLAGAAFVLAGIVGAVALPLISDKTRRRIVFVVAGMSLMAVFYLVLSLVNGFAPIMIIIALAGFTIMGLAPIVFQHGAEIAYPVPEGTSFGLILLAGQVSGALFVPAFEALSSGGSVLLPMLVIVALTAVQVPVALLMKESGALLKARGEVK